MWIRWRSCVFRRCRAIGDVPEPAPHSSGQYEEALPSIQQLRQTTIQHNWQLLHTMLALLAVLAALLLAVAKPLPDPGHALLHGTFGGATKCLAVKGGILRNGTPVVMWVSQGATLTLAPNARRSRRSRGPWPTTRRAWFASRAPGTAWTPAQTLRTDTRSASVSHRPLRLMTGACDDNVPPQQNWFWTDDNRLALTGLGGCTPQHPAYYVQHSVC